MKGLRKYLTPFAPDQSGAASVLYDLGGILVICDAGGCAGNICGFDEPRWSTRKSAVFSAGLRDMDAILGRDDRLVDKLASAAGRIGANFAALIGTPVPAVIGTDFTALGRMAQRRLKLPFFSVASNGMELYDQGAKAAYLAMFQTLSGDTGPADPGRVGVIGAIPLELGDVSDAQRIHDTLLSEGWDTVSMYGFGASYADVQTAGKAFKNIVVSPAGVPSAEYLQTRVGTPYEIRFPMTDFPLSGEDLTDARILIVQQQVYAHSLREKLRAQGAAAVTCATWFMQLSRLKEPDDVHLVEEDDFVDLVRDGGFDVIIADDTMAPMVPDFSGRWVSSAHFAVSGKQVCV